MTLQDTELLQTLDSKVNLETYVKQSNIFKPGQHPG